MKNFLFSLAFLVGVLPSAYAATPFIPEVAAKFNAIEKKTGSSDQWARQVRAVYDYSVSGGTAGDYSMNVNLPAKATITDGFLYIVNPFQGGGTFAVKCEDAGNIFTAADLGVHNAGSIIYINANGSIQNVVRGTTIADQCTVTATIAAPGITNGKAVLLLNYFVAE